MATPKAARYFVRDPDAPRLAVDYRRFSTDKQRSSVDQGLINDELADEHQVELVKSFSDEGISRSEHHRDEYDEMFEYLEAHPEIGFLIVNEYERLGAGVAQWQHLARFCKVHGITLITEDMGAIPPDDDEKWHEVAKRALKSKDELITLRNRTRRNMRSQVKHGNIVPMRPPYGVRMKPVLDKDGKPLPEGQAMIDERGKVVRSNQLELDPEEHPWLVKIFDWASEGMSAPKIAKKLTELGAPTKTGKSEWSMSTVKGILRNEFYKGRMTWGVTAVKRDDDINDGKRFHAKRPDNDPRRLSLDSPLGAIIPAEKWDAAAKKRAETAARFNLGERKTLPRQVFDGLVYCERCETKMYGRNNGSQKDRTLGRVYWGYMCQSRREPEQPGRTRCTEPHSISMTVLIKKLREYDTPGAQLTVRKGGSTIVDTSMRRREKEKIATAKAKLKRAQDGFVAGVIPMETLIETKASCEREIATAEDRLKQIGKPAFEAILPLSALVEMEFGKLLDLALDERVPVERRAEAFAHSVEKIYVNQPLVGIKLRDR